MVITILPQLSGRTMSSNLLHNPDRKSLALRDALLCPYVSPVPHGVAENRVRQASHLAASLAFLAESGSLFGSCSYE
jgi:hypothetical protein